MVKESPPSRPTLRTLRSRAFFPAQEPLEDSEGFRFLSDDPTDDDNPFQYDVFENPCVILASNEDFSVQTIDAIDMCEVDFYGGCVDTIEELLDNPDQGRILMMRVYFDYELYIRDGADEVKALNYLEDSILADLASVLQVKNCDENASGRLLTDPPTAYLDAEELERVVGISSNPTDVKDPVHVECIVPVAANIVQGLTCIPVRGSLTLFLKSSPLLAEDDEIHYQSAIMRLIRSGMQQNLYSSGNVKYVSFIGTRLDDGGVSIEIEATPASSQAFHHSASSKKIGGILGGLLAIFVLLVLALFLSLRRRRVSTDDEEGSIPPSDDKEPQLETPSRDTQDTRKSESSPMDEIHMQMPDEPPTAYAPAHWLEQKSSPLPPVVFNFEPPVPAAVNEPTFDYNILESKLPPNEDEPEEKDVNQFLESTSVDEDEESSDRLIESSDENDVHQFVDTEDEESSSNRLKPFKIIH